MQISGQISEDTHQFPGNFREFPGTRTYFRQPRTENRAPSALSPFFPAPETRLLFLSGPTVLPVVLLSKIWAASEISFAGPVIASFGKCAAAFTFREALPAVYRTVSGRLKRDLAFFLAVRADSQGQFSFPEITVLTRLPGMTILVKTAERPEMLFLLKWPLCRLAHQSVNLSL